MLVSTALSCLFLSAALGAPTPQDPPSAESALRVALADIRIQGDACDPSTPVTAQVDRDLVTITLNSNTFVATTLSFNRRIRQCQVQVRMDNPTGWQYTVVGISHVGEYALQQGTSARSRFLINGGQRGTVTSELYFQGQRAGRFNERRGVQESWSQCGERRILDVTAGIRVDIESGGNGGGPGGNGGRPGGNGGAPGGGYGMIQAPGGALHFEVGLKWRECNPNQQWSGNNGWNNGWGPWVL